MRSTACIADRVQLDATMVPANVVQLRREEAFYLESEKLADVLGSPGRLVRDVLGLLKVVSAINSIRGLIGLERPLFELILDVIPADRGAIVVLEDTGELIPGVLAWDKCQGSAPFRICKQMSDRALADGLAIFSNEIRSGDGTLARAAMAAPLIAFDRALGFIYLETSTRDVCFDTGHLHMLMIIAAIAATVLDNTRHLQALDRENQRLRDEANLQHAMVGDSPLMREVYQFISKVACGDSTILLLGESGTGKELVARAIHQNSPRSRQPFVAINCAAIIETLLESELFGYERGAFTGAVAQTRGKLEVAEGGTVFLDEIGELAPALQAKLLRVLQEHEFTRVGGTRPIKLDIRLVTATNRDLEQAAGQGLFRRDLYYRLNVVSKCLPPLREHKEDIPLLTRHFIRKYSAKVGRKVLDVSTATEQYLLNYDWPGNVRELENAVEHAIVLGSSDKLLPEDLPQSVLDTVPGEASLLGQFHAAVRDAKRQLVRAALAEASGNYTKAAKNLGLQRNYLHRLIRNLDLQDELKRSP
ncbi:MAG TPA: sigma 54-interacting transcriptional regulator [Terriglobales bacterium]|nr:sigma 54-interacting transcriptional regulator [Terriglobales bacterium]